MIELVLANGLEEASIKATNSICVTSGFKSKLSVPLKMEVIPNALNPIGLMRLVKITFPSALRNNQLNSLIIPSKYNKE
jgi:hypothetical protein